MKGLKSISAKNKVLAIAIGATLAAMSVSPSAFAQHEHGMGFHGDIAHFHEHDWATWRGGHWTHDWHDGRFGWWWLAGDIWYFYPAPIYPYPSPWEPPADVVMAPGAPTAEPAPPATRVWYYCDASQNYYPYVASCPAGWRQVPAAPGNPAPAAPVTQMQPTAPSVSPQR